MADVAIVWGSPGQYQNCGLSRHNVKARWVYFTFILSVRVEGIRGLQGACGCPWTEDGSDKQSYMRYFFEYFSFSCSCSLARSS